MRFLTMHKNDAHTEAGVKPTPEFMQRMGALIGEYVASGRFLGGEGLGGSVTRTRLRFRDGRCTVKHGPYAGEHELPAVILMLKVKTRDEAIGWAERYGKILGDGEIELGPVHEPWDLGFGEKPDGAPTRVLLIEKADAAYEAGEPRSAKQKAELTRLKTEMTKAGVLGSEEQLEPSSKSKRMVFTNNHLRVIDGPFAESKELIGGFAILRFDSMEEAMTETRRYAEVVGGTVEIDIRPLVD
jgi:hypothetical protein